MLATYVLPVLSRDGYLFIQASHYGVSWRPTRISTYWTSSGRVVFRCYHPWRRLSRKDFSLFDDLFDDKMNHHYTVDTRASRRRILCNVTSAVTSGTIQPCLYG